MTTSEISVPASWPGSVPEYIAHEAFVSLGKIPNQDFTYQAPRMGGRMEKGGAILDFLFMNPPDLSVNIQGVYYHYEFGIEAKGRDIMARAQMAGQGITLIFIDDDDLMKDPQYYCREALQYRDHSRMGGRR